MKFIKVFTATNWTKLQKTENTEQEWVHENLLQVWGFYIDFIKTSHSFRFMQSIGPEQTGGTAARLDLIGTTETWQLEFWSDWSPPLCESLFSYSFLLSCSVVRVLQPADFNHTQRFTAVFLANCLFTFLNHRLHSLLLLFPKSELNWDRKLLGVSTTSKMKNHKRRINNTKLLVVLSCSDVMDDCRQKIRSLTNCDWLFLYQNSLDNFLNTSRYSGNSAGSDSSAFICQRLIRQTQHERVLIVEKASRSRK